MNDSCGTCGNQVGESDRAPVCDVCERWEHVGCIRECDRPTEALIVSRPGYVS